MKVKVQRMFPNCEKYKKCCTDNNSEILKNTDLGKKAVSNIKTKSIKPVTVNPFPEEDVVGVIDQ